MTTTGQLLISVLLMAASIEPHQGFQWEDYPENGTVLYRCTGNSVTFPWRFTLRESEYFHDIHWLFQGAFRTEVLGSFTHDQFLPSPSYSSRLSYISNGGLRLRGVTSADEGNYTVEVNGADGSDSSLSSRLFVYLQVADGLMIRDGALKVRQDPVAVWDEVKGEWVIRLTCGTFTFAGRPPVDVVWTTPSGETTASTSYTKGHFHLDLSTSTPVESGKYTCHVPSHLLHSICGQPQRGGGARDGQKGDSDDGGVRGEVTVDGIQARLSLLEAEQIRLKKELQKAKSVSERGENKVDKLAERLQANQERSQISFHVRMNTNQNYLPGQTLKMTKVFSNQGNAYNTSTGNFIAPVSGTYVFLFTMTSGHKSFHTGALLMVEGEKVLARATAYKAIQHVHMGSNHAVVFLQQGQHVWLEVDYHHRYYWAQGTSFAAFLLPFLHPPQPPL